MFRRKSYKGIKLIKTELTFMEMLDFVHGVVQTCFITDEEGKITGYSPANKTSIIQSSFCDTYTDITYLEDEYDKEGKIIPNPEIFKQNYSKYMGVNINKFAINRKQWKDMMIAIDSEIEFRKAQLLQDTTPIGRILNKYEDFIGILTDDTKRKEFATILEGTMALNQPQVKVPQDHKPKTTKKKNENIKPAVSEVETPSEV